MTLARTLGTGDAVVVGLAAMLGTGVFVVPAAAAAEAGGLLLVALAVAALVALLNATSTASLAAAAPETGGVYAYGHQHLGAGWGFLAGAAFVVGKTASCAAAALAVGAYAVPAAPRAGAALAVLAVTAATLQGLQRTARAGAALVVAVLVVLSLVVVAALTGDGVRAGRVLDAGDGNASGVLPAAALLFFAFAGYARVTVLGGEVRDPARTIPRAVRRALLVALLAYAAVCASLLAALGADALAASDAPLAEVVPTGPLQLVVRLGAAAAALGALLSLATGVGRTAYAMAGQGDAPRLLARTPGGVPRPAQLAVGLVVLVAVLTGGLVGAVALSAATVLLYYAVAHLAVLRSGVGDRRVAAAGLVGCAVLALTLPPGTLLLGAGLLGVATLTRTGLRRAGRMRA